MSEGQQTGALSRGYLKVIEGALKEDKEKGELHFMFNPTQYSISKRSSWTPKRNKSSNVPKYEFGGGDPRELQLELFFDTYLKIDDKPQEDLRKVTNKLFNFMMIDPGPQTKGKNSHMSHPPKCQLFWGESSKSFFDCYITSCQVKFTLFNSSGVPVRATANLTLLEAIDKDQRLPTNPTSLGEPGRKMRVVKEGDRLDLIAYQEYGDSGEWRRIADANRLFDPLNLEPGRVLAIPPW